MPPTRTGSETPYEYHLADLKFGEEEERAVRDVLRSGWLTNGEVTRAFEREFGELVGSRAIAVSSGTAALHLALAALGIGPGDEVIVPSYTFIATVNAIRYQGATPVFIDINGAQDLNMDVDLLPALVSSRTRTIVAVHIGGYAADMHEIVRFAREHDLSVVEDAAHAPGATLGGRHLGTFGDVGCFSFFANKNLATGEGGMLVTSDARICDLAGTLRSHGSGTTSWTKSRGGRPPKDIAVLGFNYRTTEIQSALGRTQLARLEANNARRRDLTAIYRERLARLGNVTVPFLDNPALESAHILPIVLDRAIDRDAVAERLAHRGVQTAVHYPPAHLYSLYADTGAILPRTEDISRRELTLPLHPLLEPNDVGHICDRLVEAIAAA